MPTLSFLNPAFLWALPAASLPILIHLLSRQRLPEVRFPTTQFLRQLEPREIRRLRLREILLLILRTLALLLSVLAFARPSLAPRGAVTHAAAAVGILLDDSESMAALDDRARPRMEGAVARALAIADAGRAGDELYLARATRPGEAEIGRARDRVRLRRSIERIEAEPLPARLESSLHSLRLALGRSPLKARELYVISDLQRASLTPEARREITEAAAAGIRVILLPVSEGRTPNHAFTAVDPVTRPGPEGRGLEVRARLVNYADGPSDRLALRVRRGEALVGGGDAALKGGESRWVSMPLEPGAVNDPAIPVVAESDEDALPLDDRWYAVLGAPRRLRVLRIAEPRGAAPAPRFAALALDPSGDGTSGFTVETAGPSALLGLSKSRADVVVLEDVASLSADAEARLKGYVKEGGGLVVALGPHADPEYYTKRLFPGLVDLTLAGPDRSAEGTSFELRARLPGHPILEGLALGVGSPLTQARLSGMMRSRTASARAEVVVQTTGGLPLVVAAPSVAVFLSSFADDWGDLPYSGAFVPLVRGLVSYAARASESEPGSEPRVGERPFARLEAAPSGAVVARGPAGFTSPAAVENEGAAFRAVADAPAMAAGFYTFEAGGKALATVALNPDPVESDLAAVPADSLKADARGPNGAPVLSIDNRSALATRLGDTRRGRELWLPLLVLAGVFLIGEILLGSARVLDR
ncbi:MAG TPA: BatA domain-containing protein [Candidatus Eisenbacteria bacterium]|nr:BatA domain-containing protein [Candidatus Eisenbacteria bacterium]